MGDSSENKPKKQISAGLLAHVDAGKTTLSEGMLYLSGAIRKLGRVDHGDAFFDHNQLERERGITIFSKQAVIDWKELQITLLDTPGHVDFSAEMERTLRVLDCAILVISGSEGVQGHTETVWKLLEQYQIPVFLFINKMDLNGANQEELMQQLKQKLSDNCIDFSPNQEQETFYENLAMCDEALLDEYMERSVIEKDAICAAIAARHAFPCYFGSALKLQGIEAFLDGLADYIEPPFYLPEFGARVFKIVRDKQNMRITFLKITGGALRVKDCIGPDNTEKIDQIRFYSGSKYELREQAPAGAICAVTGPVHTFSGQGLGFEEDLEHPILEPVLTYQLLPPSDCSVIVLLEQLRQLEEEDPQLHIVWKEELQEIHIQVMGEVQIEILKGFVRERFGYEIEFSQGSVVYKETIADPVEGVGHFEPLRHYAEVHLLLEPLPLGSGLEFATDVSEDLLDKNWQRLIITHLKEKQHLGVLTGSPVTDMRITLINGKAHLKHTEGGDFREATYRAVRHGLMQAKSVLLEPYFSFRLELPIDAIGRAMTDIGQMGGETKPPEIHESTAVLKGQAPVAAFRGYIMEVTSYTKGKGRVTCRFCGYGPCQDAEERAAQIGYDCESDLDNPAGSVFCSHGAGYYVNWRDVEQHMHLEKRRPKQQFSQITNVSAPKKSSTIYSGSYEQDRELEAIFERTFGAPKRRTEPGNRLGYEKRPDGKVDAEQTKDENKKYKQKKNDSAKEEYLLVDGYNIIFAWEELSELAKDDLGAARGALMDILSNYQGFCQCHLILVFDAYKVKGNPGKIMRYHNIDVVYTKEAETADMYIEKTAHQYVRHAIVKVATSDALEQMIIIGQGARRLSANDLREEILHTSHRIQEEYLKQTSDKNYLDLNRYKGLEKFFTQN